MAKVKTFFHLKSPLSLGDKKKLPEKQQKSGASTAGSQRASTPNELADKVWGLISWVFPTAVTQGAMRSEVP